MQTLPTPVSQTKALSLADVANQNGSHVNVNKSSTENAKASFQAELNRQVRVKQNQAQLKQDKSAESLKNQTQQKTSAKDSVEVDKKAFTTNQNVNVSQTDDSFLSDLNKQLDAARELSSKGTLDESKDVPQAIAAKTETGNAVVVAELIPTLGTTQVLQSNANTMQLSSELGASNTLDTTDLAAQQKNLMAAFNSSTTAVQTGPKSTDVALAVAENTDKSKDSALADVLATKAESKSATDELASNKATVNIAVSKETLIKEATPNLIQPQATTVSAVQNGNNIVSQQLASSNMISVYPGKSGWDQAISQKVVWMVGAGQQSASLTLNPPDLGPLKVVINVHNDQADTTFISDNDEVRKALETGMSNLRDKMNESGIQLGQANVSTSQQSQQDFQQAAQNRVFQSAKDQASSEVIESVAQSKVTMRVSDGLVDTFA
jgi:flagellar hook-length control protein FliK